ncbi:MAG: glycosyltransferase [Nitrospinales bacterium]
MIYILIPVFNEEENIPPLVTSIDQALKTMREEYRVIFVNDGSTDGTAGEIQKHMKSFPLDMLENKPNQGVGVSFDKGFKHFIAQGKSGDILITMEGDNTADLNTLPQLVDEIRKGKDFVLASVYSEKGEIIGTTPLRLGLSYTANFLCRLIFKVHGVSTFTSFYRGYAHSALKELYEGFHNEVITERGYICMVEILLRLYHGGFSFSEVPTLLDGTKRIGFSKLKKVETIKAYLRLFIRHILSRKPYNRFFDHKIKP